MFYYSHAMFSRESRAQSFITIISGRPTSGDSGPPPPPSITSEFWTNRRIFCDFAFSTLGVALRHPFGEFWAKDPLLILGVQNSDGTRRARVHGSSPQEKLARRRPAEKPAHGRRGAEFGARWQLGCTWECPEGTCRPNFGSKHASRSYQKLVLLGGIVVLKKLTQANPPTDPVPAPRRFILW